MVNSTTETENRNFPPWQTQFLVFLVPIFYFVPLFFISNMNIELEVNAIIHF